MKLFPIYGELHPKSDVDRLYIPRKEGGRGLICIEDCVKLAIGLEVYVNGSKQRLIHAAGRDQTDGLEAARNQRKENIRRFGQYLRQTKEVSSHQCLAWLQNRDLKRETKSLIVAARNQS